MSEILMYWRITVGSLIIDLSLGDKNDIRNYLYMDIKFDLQKTANNRDVVVAKDFDAVSQGIYNIFLFAPGERIILPEFGNSLYKYVYEPESEGMLDRMKIDVQEMIERWEPRVKIMAVEVVGKPDENRIDIEILYIVPSLGDGVIRRFNAAVNARR